MKTCTVIYNPLSGKKLKYEFLPKFKKILEDHGYETEIILRIYWKKQSLTYISYNMDFIKYGKPQRYYSVRSLNNFHKEAFLKLLL